MPITYVSSASEENNSITSMPSHVAGDLLLMIAFGYSAVPSLAAGWTSGYAPGNNLRVGYKFATSGSEVSGTWTNGTMLFCHVYRGASRTPIGATAVNSGSGSTMTYPALTLQRASLSWAVRGGYAKAGTSDPALFTPSGFTGRQAIDSVGYFFGRSSDTNAEASSVTSYGQSMGPHTYAWAALSIELLAAEGGALFWAFP